MVQFKKLEWRTREDDVIYADPEGLLKAYYIYFPHTENNESELFELALIHDNGYLDNSDITTHNSLEEAKNKAQIHYENVLHLHCID